MNCIRTSFVVLALIGLTACASQPATDQYYSLVLAADSVTPTASAEKAETLIIVGPIQLARYLSQPGLPLQTGTSQIQTANHHFWAEPLDEAISKVLVGDISQRVDNVAVDRVAGRWTGDGDCQVRVEFDKFHPTENSQVVATGRYWIHESAGARVTKKEFEIVQTLSENGYAHAVHKLRASLAILASEIVGQMSASAVCLSRTD
ncbi:MAG: PqiC family protein [Gammaproteobacteria bacterium]|nr:PqiC family protein [Gammaproteobacteria bacterium]MDH3767117.1 PqiC family protein [Gammaproteobacteria bacterium]